MHKTVMLSTSSQGLIIRLDRVANGLDLPTNTAEPNLTNPMTVVSSSVTDFWPKDQGLLHTHGKIPMSPNETLNLGPVEKAVFQQAMYNQSKKKTPAMRRCDDCNVIFNSQVQAEMHYKGKKHARIMYLKRSRDRKISTSRVNSYLANVARETEHNTNLPCNNDESGGMTTHMEHKDSASSVMSASSPTSTLNFASTSRMATRMKYSNTTSTCCTHYNIANPTPYEFSATCNTEIEFTDASTRLEVEDKTTLRNASDGVVQHQQDLLCDQRNGAHTPKMVCENIIQPPAKIPDESSPSAESCEEERGGESTGPPTREPAILPDPLPGYIKKVERPAVLKESLRCNVCDIYVNSENQMRQHINSLRHKNIEQGIPIPPKPGKEDKPKTRAEQFKCEVCRVTLNSDIQLLQHLSSQRHKNMLEGKPPKPRWTPYERAQQAILRSAAQLRLPYKTIPSTNQPILTTPGIAGSIPISALPVVAQPALQNAVLSAGAPTAHLKQTAFIGPNGSLYQTREIVYVGAAPNGYHGTYHQQQLGAAPASILAQQPLHLQQQCDLAHLINAANGSIGIDQTSMGI